MPAFEISVLAPSSTYAVPRAARSWRCPPTSEPASGSVIAKAAIALPWAIGPSQRSFCAGDPPSRIGVVPSPWSANTASASGEASPSASRIRQQPRRSRSRIGWSQPPAPRSSSSARASFRAAGVVRGLGAPGDLARREGSGPLGESRRDAARGRRGSARVSGMAYSNFGSRLARNAS